jgi:hypothetical protein
MPKDLKDKVALVTGCSYAIGPPRLESPDGSGEQKVRA